MKPETYNYVRGRGFKKGKDLQRIRDNSNPIHSFYRGSHCYSERTLGLFKATQLFSLSQDSRAGLLTCNLFQPHHHASQSTFPVITFSSSNEKKKVSKDG